MPKYVLDVGNCPPDHAAIRRVIDRNFDAVVLQAHVASDALATLERHRVDLVLVNRKLDQDYSDGLDVIAQIKSHPKFAEIPVMLVTNYEEHQQRAIQAGAEQGFGKLSLSNDETIDNLRRFLE